MPFWKSGWVALPILAAGAAAGAALAALRGRTEGRRQDRPCAGVSPDGGILAGVSYVERRSGGAPASATLPMLVVLHAGGANPVTFADRAATGIPVPARIVAPVGFTLLGDDDGEGHFYWRDPADPRSIQDAAAGLAGFLEEIRLCRPTDGRPIVAGYDEGGDVAYALAADEPQAIDRAIVAGARPEPALVPRSPVVALHGLRDADVPFAEASAVYHQRISEGAPVKLLPMVGVDHSFMGALQIQLWHAASQALHEITPMVGTPPRS